MQLYCFIHYISPYFFCCHDSLYSLSFGYSLKRFLCNLFTRTAVRGRFTIRSQVTYIYIWEIWYASDKMKAVTRKGRRGMNLSWKSKWQRQGKGEAKKAGSREVVEWPFFSCSPEVCRCRRKEKDGREIKVDTDGNLRGGERDGISTNERPITFVIINSNCYRFGRKIF